VIDNLSVHKVAGVEEAIERRGARVEYLPKYSPDLNPIELSFSKFKAYLRKFSEQTIPALHRRVAAFITTRRMPLLLPACRLCVNLTGIRCKSNP
jgi:transposase